MWSFHIYLGAMFVLFHSIFIGLPDFLKEGIDTVKYYLMFMDYSLLDWLIPKTWIPTMWSFIFGIGVPLIKFFFFLYTASRVSLLLPVISIDAKPPLFRVWNLSQENGWRLVFLATIPLIPYYLGGLILNGATMIFPFYWILGIVGIAWFVFWMILEAAILSEVYKELSVRRQVPSLTPHFDFS